MEGGAGRAWSWSSWHRPDKGRQAHRLDRVLRTHSTLCNKAQGRGKGWAQAGTRHNNHRKLKQTRLSGIYKKQFPKKVEARKLLIHPVVSRPMFRPELESSAGGN